MEQTLQELTELIGPCGYEHDVVRYLVQRLDSIADQVKVDGVGNVIAVLRGAHPGPALVISTHMDEVGFVVKKIENNGLIRFEKLGGHDDRILLAQRVKIATAKGYQLGVIGTISAHMVKFDNPATVRKHSELYIDVGAQSKDEVTKMGICVGDPIGWSPDMQTLGEHRLVGKSFDDRAGCATLLETLASLDRDELHGTVYGVFSVQEEVGLRGAKVAGAQVNADVALAVDTTAVSDTPEAMMDGTLALGAGPGIKVMDFSLIASKAVRNRLVHAAEQGGIPYQLEVFPGIGTDAGELTLANAGVPTGVISIPTRYAHSPIEVMDRDDFANTARLLKAFILTMRDRSEFDFLMK
ncbi:endoglucanase [Alicyclobacillus ferrooxydans]|uniref:Endoglucanase n=1 Tax=Alicyclobacillus ferrooxydans TaxID=471514 RepID=A0A0P9CNP9_9BACL|nr:endoglucanase [Alicyclobacillus ferrooxydans]